MRREIKIYPYHWIRLIMIALLGFLLLSLFSCKVREKIVTQYEIIDTMFFVEKYEVKYDTLRIPPDSAYIKAYLQCDSAGNVLIRALNEEKGKIRLKTVFRDNIIEVKVNVDSAEIIRRAEQEFLRNYKSISTQTESNVQKKRTFAWYYYFLSGVGFGVIIILIIKQLWKKFKTVLFLHP